MIVWDPIAPGEKLRRGINWEARLCGETIASSTWDYGDGSPTSITLTSNNPTFNGPNTMIILSDAVLHNTYFIKNTITTSAGGIEIETVQITCVPK